MFTKGKTLKKNFSQLSSNFVIFCIERNFYMKFCYYFKTGGKLASKNYFKIEKKSNLQLERIAHWVTFRHSRSCKQGIFYLNTKLCSAQGRKCVDFINTLNNNPSKFSFGRKQFKRRKSAHFYSLRQFVNKIYEKNGSLPASAHMFFNWKTIAEFRKLSSVICVCNKQYWGRVKKIWKKDA